MPKDQVIVDSDGSLVRYPDPYGDVTPERIETAERLQREVFYHNAQIDRHYFFIGGILSEIKEQEYFRELGFDTFRAWADSPELKGIGWRTAHNLIRITNEVLPIIERHNAFDALPSVSTMVNLLPILSDDNAEEKFIEALYEVKELPVHDAKERIRDLRGIGRTIEDERPAIFKAQVTRGEQFHTIRVWCSTGTDYYEAGTLNIKPRDWPRWEQHFSERFIEYVN